MLGKGVYEIEEEMSIEELYEWALWIKIRNERDKQANKKGHRRR